MSAIPALLRAALPSIPVVNQLPGVKKAPVAGFTGLTRTRPPVTVDRAAVEAYAAVCGFPTKDVVPLPYPHLLVFDLQMAIMSDPAFPAPAIGTVHVENSITQHRPIAIGESLSVVASVGAPVPHPKGVVYEFVTEVRAGAELVWEETSAYLRRGVSTGSTTEEGSTTEGGSTTEEGASYGMALPEAAPTPIRWELPADLGRRYAAVSGDANPIHLYPVTAKALGFPRQIAHGMWTMARCVAALENRLPDAVRVDVAFKKPVLLPGTVAFGVTPLDDGIAFGLTSPSGKAHLAGRTTSL
ncbi:MaoC family dehydratase [Nocardioides plantarum]|uniref:MaoC family dehydratase n=1 Tax=Nocardioides plantarum TaxID=29299 RepID=A0ABV5K7W5_9ACTN|nr:MaoC/PaaZ C-terminal domain-containing protein [Nocardioides plantarum]